LLGHFHSLFTAQNSELSEVTAPQGRIYYLSNAQNDSILQTEDFVNYFLEQAAFACRTTGSTTSDFVLSWIWISALLFILLATSSGRVWNYRFLLLFLVASIGRRQGCRCLPIAVSYRFR
jgi:hypothetical protein